MKTPRVTVILPTHNSPDTLSFAAHSVLKQTLRDFELAIVIDGGSEGTQRVAETISVKDPRVSLLRFPKGEGFGNEWRDLVIRNAQSELIAYIDDDDLWLPHHLETLVRRIDEEGRDIVCSSVVTVTPANRLEIVLTDHSSGLLRSRLGDYRAIFDTHVVHTKNAYMELSGQIRSPQEMFAGFGANSLLSWGHEPLPTAMSLHGVSMRAAGLSGRERRLKNGDWYKRILAGRVNANYLVRRASVVGHLWLLFSHVPPISFESAHEYLFSLSRSISPHGFAPVTRTWTICSSPQERMIQLAFQLWKAIAEKSATPIMTRQEMVRIVRSLQDTVRSDRPSIDPAMAKWLLEGGYIRSQPFWRG